MLNVYVGYVSDVKDAACGQRITAVIPSDEGKSPNTIPPAFPLLPKMIHIVPKIGEAVIVFVANDDEPNGQRYYLGPIISQPDKMNEDSFKSLSATRLLNNGIQPPDKSVTNFGSNFGALPERKDIALLGRKNTDIILTENELRVRAGCRLTKPGENKVDFNNGEPAFIKLKYHENGLPVRKNENEEVPSDTIRSTATVVADKINLLSHGAQEHFKLNDWEEGISDTEMQRIIDKAQTNEVTVLIDEAYHYFYEKTFLHFALEYRNVFVTRTFTKMFGLISENISDYSIWTVKISGSYAI